MKNENWKTILLGISKECFFLITALYSNIVLKDSFNIEDCTKIVAYLDSKYYYRGKKNWAEEIVGYY